MAVTGISATTPTLESQQAVSRGFQDLKTEDFVKILLAQLQNQNPLEPLDNNQLLTQVSSINNLTSMQKLNDTLDGLNVTQTLASASSYIGKKVTATLDQDTTIEGTVQKALLEKGQITLLVNDKKVPIDKVTEVGS